MKGLRVAGARTLEQANAYLQTEFILWWNQTLAVAPASPDDAHRLLDQQHCLAASLSYVETRQVNNAYTIQFDNKIYQIARSDIQTGLRKAAVRVEIRLDNSIAVRFGNRYLTVTECAERPKAEHIPQKPVSSAQALRRKSQWMQNFHLTRRKNP